VKNCFIEGTIILIQLRYWMGLVGEIHVCKKLDNYFHSDTLKTCWLIEFSSHAKFR